MIKLSKEPEPRILEQFGTAWAQRYVDHVENGASIAPADRTRYRHPDIKTVLRLETAEKCAYCESKIVHVAFGDVEHILPKSRRPELVVSWSNLTLVCSVCNSAKGDYFEPTHPLLNPYNDDPSEHLQFLGPLVMGRIADPLGDRTVRRLKLQRIALIERKKDRLEALKVLVDTWATMPFGPDKDLVRTQILDELADDKEFAATARAFVEDISGIAYVP